MIRPSSEGKANVSPENLVTTSSPESVRTTTSTGGRKKSKAEFKPAQKEPKPKSLVKLCRALPEAQESIVSCQTSRVIGGA